MGLDMYLYRSVPTKPWEDVKWDDFGRSNQVYEKRCVAYWRKANAIHKYFVDKTQEGNDICLESYVPRSLLADLVEICEKICKAEGIDAEAFNLKYLPEDFFEKPMKDGARLAEKLLPPCQGFFFGSYELDGSYLYDLIKTVQMLKPLLLEDDHADFSYEASW